MKAADHKAQAEEKAVQLETATDSPDEDSVGMITVMGKEEALTVRAAAVLRETEIVHSEIQDSEKQADSPARSNEGRPSRPGDSRPGQRQGAGQGGRFGQGRPQGAGRGEGRPDNRDNRGEGRGDGRFSQGRGGQRQGARRSTGASDTVFTPELTKGTKDSKRERDRENKNKKKDFDKTSGGHRPNQGGRGMVSRLPKALQKLAPQQKQPEEKKQPEVKEITLPEKMTIRELADSYEDAAICNREKAFHAGTDGNCKP